MSFTSFPSERSIRRLLGAALLLPGICPLLSAAENTAAGTVSGVVLNSANGHFVQGAAVTLEGTTRTEQTNSQGAFVFGGVAAGHYTVSADASGASRGMATVDVTAGQTAKIAITLNADVVAMQPLIVTAQVEGQAQSLNLQKNAANFRNV